MEDCGFHHSNIIERNLEINFPTLWTNEMQNNKETERKKRLEKRRIKKTNI